MEEVKEFVRLFIEARGGVTELSEEEKECLVEISNYQAGQKAISKIKDAKKERLYKDGAFAAKECASSLEAKNLQSAIRSYGKLTMAMNALRGPKTSR